MTDPHAGDLCTGHAGGYTCDWRRSPYVTRPGHAYRVIARTADGGVALRLFEGPDADELLNDIDRWLGDQDAVRARVFPLWRAS